MSELSSLFREIQQRYGAASVREAPETVTVNDLREREEQGKHLTGEEQAALRNYEQFRLRELNSAAGEDDFHRRFKLLQALANLSPYTEFLKKKYE